MIFEIYDGINELPEIKLSAQEIKLDNFLRESLISFPIHRIRVRKNYSDKEKEISIDVEIDSTLTSEKIYNKIVYRIFKTLQIDLITLQNNSNYSNFPYFFYGEKVIFDYFCSIFIDAPKKAYRKGEINYNN